MNLEHYTKQIIDKNLDIKALMIKADDKILTYGKLNELYDIRSISKTVLTLTAGILKEIHPHEFNENTYIYPIIKDVINVTNETNLEYLKKIKVKHLLTHTIGYEEVLLMRNDILQHDPFDLLDFVVNYPIIQKPGTYYLYSNAGFYLLSVVMEEFIGKNLIQFIDEHLFNPLNIKDYKWEKYGKYLAGATRLWLKPNDLLKIGQLMLENDGSMVPVTWINYMKTLSTLTPNVDTLNRTFRRYGYGHGLWISKDEGLYFAHGTDGQILLMVPKKKAIILTLSTEKNMHEIENIVELILNNL